MSYLSGKYPTTFGIIIAFIGIMWMIIAPVLAKDKMKRCTETAEGKVMIAHDSDTGIFSSYSYEIRYYIGEEPYYAYEGSSKYVTIGKEVTVHYNPDKKSENYIEELSDTPLSESLYGLFGIGFGAFLIIGDYIKNKKTYYVSKD